MAKVNPGEIRNGIEWYTVTLADGRKEEDCQCARCGSSAGPVECGQCSHGLVEHENWEGFGETYPVACDFCGGNSTSWHCVSSPEWCAANPLPGREHIESTAMRAEAWRD